jgi:hypothetical protein
MARPSHASPARAGYQRQQQHESGRLCDARLRTHGSAQPAAQPARTAARQPKQLTASIRKGGVMRHGESSFPSPRSASSCPGLRPGHDSMDVRAKRPAGQISEHVFTSFQLPLHPGVRRLPSTASRDCGPSGRPRTFNRSREGPRR